MKTHDELKNMAYEATKQLPGSCSKSDAQNAFIAGYTACQEEDRWVLVSEHKNIEPAYYITSENGNVRVLAYDGIAFINRDGIDVNVQYFINNPLPNPPKK